MDSKNDSKKFNLDQRGILPGFADGRYEPARKYDPNEFANSPLEDPSRRDHRVSIRVSGRDMNELRRMALAEGLPLQSLLAQIVHQYAIGELGKVGATSSELSALTLPPALEADDPLNLPDR